jgi:hypothetical protein
MSAVDSEFMDVSSEQKYDGPQFPKFIVAESACTGKRHLTPITPKAHVDPLSLNG